MATEHMDALRALVVDANVIHPSTPYTILRGAIESGAAAVWLLSPDAPAERQLRALRHGVRDTMDGDTAATGFGLAPAMSLDQRRAQLNELGRAVTGDPSCVVKPAISTEMLTAADTALAAPGPGPLLMWRLCSGFAHGRMWARLGYLEREVHPTSEPGDAWLITKNTISRLPWPLLVAQGLTATTLQLLIRRGRSPYCVPRRAELPNSN